MKIFAAVLSIFFFCLATMPCADEAPAENHALELAQEQNHDHNDQADDCTPFCHCHCCHVHVTMVAANQALSNLVANQKQVSVYRSFALNDISISLFRPPIV